MRWAGILKMHLGIIKFAIVNFNRELKGWREGYTHFFKLHTLAKYLARTTKLSCEFLIVVCFFAVLWHPSFRYELYTCSYVFLNYVFPSQMQADNKNQREKNVSCFLWYHHRKNKKIKFNLKFFVVKSRKMVKSNYQGGKPSVCQ